MPRSVGARSLNYWTAREVPQTAFSLDVGEFSLRIFKSGFSKETKKTRAGQASICTVDRLSSCLSIHHDVEAEESF